MVHIFDWRQKFAKYVFSIFCIGGEQIRQALDLLV